MIETILVVVLCMISGGWGAHVIWRAIRPRDDK